MQSNFENCLKKTLKYEGGYVDHLKDPGGATNLGVTKKVWEAWVGHEVTKDTIKALTVADVTPLYRKKYWDVCRCDDLPAGLDDVIFDIAVNSGTSRAAKFLQSAVGVVADGVVGNLTLNALGHCTLPTKDLINIICDRRVAFWKSLPTFSTFGKGWLARGEEVRKQALAMAGV